ncbi:Mastin [Myotis davidii]|uniref:Mastin n=1 Tax=Myotis davidii TaxID=225400 RepID=L5LSQ4_MYODS|nr:Mastin [Myotis davidii]
MPTPATSLVWNHSQSTLLPGLSTKARAQKDWKQYLVVGKEQKPGPAVVLNQRLPTALRLWPYQLQEVMVPIVGNEVCNQRYQNSSTNTGQIIKDDMLCAGSEGQDSCQGDSGGPLVCSWEGIWVQVGIVSWGYSCGHRDFPGVYARVMSYISWIRKYVPPPPGS